MACQIDNLFKIWWIGRKIFFSGFCASLNWLFEYKLVSRLLLVWLLCRTYLSSLWFTCCSCVKGLRNSLNILVFPSSPSKTTNSKVSIMDWVVCQYPKLKILTLLVCVLNLLIMSWAWFPGPKRVCRLFSWINMTKAPGAHHRSFSASSLEVGCDQIWLYIIQRSLAMKKKKKKA